MADQRVLPRLGGINDPFVAWLPVATEGYAWMAPDDARGDDAALELADDASVFEPGGARSFAPLSVPDLHRRFARVQPTRQGILAFANQYGELAHGRWSSRPDRTGETLRQWQRAIGEVRGLLTLWSLVRQRNSATLGQLIHKVERGKREATYAAGLSFTARGLDMSNSSALAEVAAEQVGTRRYFVLGEDWHEETLEQSLAPGALTVIVGDMGRRPNLWSGYTFHPGGFQRAEFIGNQPCGPTLYIPRQPAAPAPPGASEPPRTLVGAARALLLALITCAIERHVSVRVTDDTPGGFAVVPDCLSAAIYVAFALDVIGRTAPVRRCAAPSCNQPYAPNHARRRYCSDACRKSDFRAGRQGNSICNCSRTHVGPGAPLEGRASQPYRQGE